MSINVTTDLRRFTRDFTRRAGLLRKRLYDADLSLTEARIIYEIAVAGETTAETIREVLDLDKGYLSRAIQRLEKRGWVRRAMASDDRRTRRLSLTDEGQALFERIDLRSTEGMERMIAHLSPLQRRQLSEALMVVDRLTRPSAKQPEIVIRPHGIGDLGHVVSRHGALYDQEYGWDITFEAAVAEIVVNFIRNFDPARERCLIAEIGGAIAGSATIVREDNMTAKLRIVYVEPWARGHGLGERLVRDCMDFARNAGYQRMTLWTNDVLKPARKLYERLGFRLVNSKAHRSYGVDLVGEVWERKL